jgi:lipopolysaccharide export LptBFGC system permease protein LptF
MYKDVAKNIEDFTLQIPKTVIPIPTEFDYDNGFIRRYFIQKTNDSNGFVFEVSEEVHDELRDNAFWKVADLKWRITGPKETVYNQKGELSDIGVEITNKQIINLTSKTIRNISLYLPNLLQFHK